MMEDDIDYVIALNNLETDKMNDQIQFIKEQLEKLGQVRFNLSDGCNSCREMSLVLTKIDEATLWLSYLLDIKEGLQPEVEG